MLDLLHKEDSLYLLIPIALLLSTILIAFQMMVLKKENEMLRNRLTKLERKLTIVEKSYYDLQERVEEVK